MAEDRGRRHGSLVPRHRLTMPSGWDRRHLHTEEGMPGALAPKHPHMVALHRRRVPAEATRGDTRRDSLATMLRRPAEPFLVRQRQAHSMPPRLVPTRRQLRRPRAPQPPAADGKAGGVPTRPRRLLQVRLLPLPVASPRHLPITARLHLQHMARPRRRQQVGPDTPMMTRRERWNMVSDARSLARSCIHAGK